MSELLRVLVECPRVCIIRFCLGLSRSSDLGNATFGSLGFKIWIKMVDQLISKKYTNVA